MATYTNASSLSGVRSYDFDRRRERFSQPNVRVGDFGTWELTAYAPNRFAAIAPICGGGETYWAERFPHLPLWAFHRAKDSGVPPQRSQAMVDAL